MCRRSRKSSANLFVFALVLFGLRSASRRRHGSARVQGAVRKLLLVGRLEDLKGAHERLVDRHHGTGVVELATVVGRREERH